MQVMAPPSRPDGFARRAIGKRSHQPSRCRPSLDGDGSTQAPVRPVPACLGEGFVQIEPGRIWRMLSTHLAPQRFGDCVRPHLTAMHAAARAVLRSDDLAWDAVQVALLRLWSHGHVEERSRAFLTRSAHLASLGILRSSHRRCRHEGAAESQRRAWRRPLEPAELVVAREVPTELDSLVRELPAECREVLELRVIQQLSYEVIARNLDIPIGTVRSRLHRARRILKKRVAA